MPPKHPFEAYDACKHAGERRHKTRDLKVRAVGLPLYLDSGSLATFVVLIAGDQPIDPICCNGDSTFFGGTRINTRYNFDGPARPFFCFPTLDGIDMFPTFWAQQ